MKPLGDEKTLAVPRGRRRLLRNTVYDCLAPCPTSRICQNIRNDKKSLFVAFASLNSASERR
jgi:hypothetical protein